MIQLIDTHSHLYDEAFDNDRNDAVERALQAGVGLMLLPAIDPDSYQQQHELAESNPSCFREMMGLHPTSIKEDYQQLLAITKQLLFDHRERYVAVGEIGLDYYWDRTFEQQQQEVLITQMGWAQELDLPVTLHVRNAYNELFELLRSLNRSRFKGVMHCFGGTVEQALEAIEMGLHIGIGGVVTFKKSLMADVVKAIPLTSIVLETDAPYLAPVPHRGHRNESAFVLHVAEKVAQLKELPLETVAKITTANARKLFKL